MNWQRTTGTFPVALTVLFLAMDAGFKIVGARAAVSATGRLGYTAITTHPS